MYRTTRCFSREHMFGFARDHFEGTCVVFRLAVIPEGPASVWMARSTAILLTERESKIICTGFSVGSANSVLYLFLQIAVIPKYVYF